MTEEEARAFVRERGIVMEAARAQVPSLVETVIGEPVSGSWWAHPRGNEAFAPTRAVRNSPEILVCRLVDGKVTYVHRRLWPHLVKLADEFEKPRLAAIREVHTKAGRHRVVETPYPEWVSREVEREARQLDDAEARAALTMVLRSD